MYGSYIDVIFSYEISLRDIKEDWIGREAYQCI